MPNPRLARLLQDSARWPFRAAVDGLKLIWRRPLRFVGSMVKVFALFHLVEAYGVTWAPAEGPSMLPTLETLGDSVLVSRLHRFGRSVRVGDLVVYVIPPFPTTVGIKRVIGMPGDYVLKDSPDSGSGEMIQVPEGHCWLAGDNLRASRDSRTFGPVPLALVKGKAIAKVLPWSEARWIRNPIPPEPASLWDRIKQAP